MAIRDLGTILTIWAHPDDETYLAGGLMAGARDLGQRVVCASATAGERGTEDPASWPPERLARVRRWEATAAMAVLGVTEHRLHTLPDGELEAHEEAGRAWVDGLFDMVEPDTVISFGPDGMTHHPDHLAVHRWVVGAWEHRARRSRLLWATTTPEHLRHHGRLYERWGVYMSEHRPAGVAAERLAAHLRLEGEALDRKLTALRAMATQTTAAIGLLGESTYACLVAEECFVDADATA